MIRLLPAQGGDEEAVGIVAGGENGEAAGRGVGGEAKSPVGRRELRDKRGVGGQKRPDHIFVFKVAERAGGVDELAAGANEGRVLSEECELLLGGRGDLGRGGGPLEVRRPAPGAGAAARGVDEDSVVKRSGRGREDCDVVKAGAGGADLKFLQV